MNKIANKLCNTLSYVNFNISMKNFNFNKEIHKVYVI